MDEGEGRARVTELIRDGWQRRQQTCPSGGPFRSADVRGGYGGQSRAGTRDPVVEPQHPDPSSGEDMVDRGIIDGVRRRLFGRPQPIPPFHAFEMSVEALRWWKPSMRRFAEMQRAVQESARPAGVDHE